MQRDSRFRDSYSIGTGKASNDISLQTVIKRCGHYQSAG